MKKFITTLILLFILIVGGTYFISNVYSKSGNLLGIEGIGKLIDDSTKLEDSKITGEDVYIDENYSIYYTFLTEDGKKLYKQIYANMLEGKDKFIPVININVEDISDVIDAVIYDHPEIFWFDSSYTYLYTKDNICRQIILSYNDLINDLDSNKAIFNDKINTILGEANNYSSLFEKEKFIHDYLINNNSYNLGAKYNQTAYSALVNGSTVCAGYSKAFQLLMTKLGIPTYYVVGISKDENHAWNIVNISGNYYNVDVTWDDSSYNKYKYYNKSDRDFTSHVREDLSLLLPSCNSTYQEKKVTIQKKKEIVVPKKEIVVDQTPSSEKEVNKDVKEEVVDDQDPAISEETIPSSIEEEVEADEAINNDKVLEKEKDLMVE